MILGDIDQLCSNLEKQELESANGIASPSVYAQLLAIYLYQNDLCNAKFLFKRIPPNIVASNPELVAIWQIGQNMWKKDLPGTYRAISSYTWTEPVSDIIKVLEEKTRERAFNLISRSYSSISMETVSGMVGMSMESAAAACAARGWNVAAGGGEVAPLPPPCTAALHTSSEDQLFKLTEFVSFLEN